MANWTQQEMEELLAKMTKKAMTDAEFRKEVLADANKALEKLAGKPLPEGSSLKCIERDPNYQTTFVLPDLVDEEKLNDESLSNVAGGISVAAIISVCAAAVGVGPSVIPSACLAKPCAADLCSVEACGNRACGGHAAGLSACYNEACEGRACGSLTKGCPLDSPDIFVK